jgi:hypothetical protein
VALLAAFPVWVVFGGSHLAALIMLSLEGRTGINWLCWKESGYMEHLLLTTAVNRVEASNDVAVTNKTETPAGRGTR